MFGIPRLYAMIGIGVAVALFVAWVWRVDSLRDQYKRERDSERVAATLFAERVRSKSEEIARKASENARRIETAYATINQENDGEIRARIAAAVNAVRLRTGTSGANPGSGRNAVPSPSGAASGTTGAGSQALVPSDDLIICTEAVVKAEGWQAWWKSVEAVER